MKKVVQIGIAITASAIAWCAVTVRANAVTVKLDDSSVKKIADFQIGDQLSDRNSEYSNAFVYKSDYDPDIKNWSLNYKTEVEPVGTQRVKCTKPNGKPCITPSAIPEPDNIIASITAAGLFIAIKRKIKSSRNAQVL